MAQFFLTHSVEAFALSVAKAVLIHSSEAVYWLAFCLNIVRQIKENYVNKYETICVRKGKAFDSSGQWRRLLTPLDRIQLHIRGGYIIPWQHPANTTVYRLETSNLVET